MRPLNAHAGTDLGGLMLLTWRAATRSGTTLSLGLLLLLVCVLFPLLLRGDGTLTGKVQISLGYTLGVMRFLLGAVAVWCGSAAVAGDVADRHIRLIITKPVHPARLWLGRWLGLSMLLAALLVFGAGLAYAMLQVGLRRQGASPGEWRELNEEILVARKLVPSEEPGLDAEADRLLREFDSRDPAWRDQLSDRQWREALRHAALLSRNRIAPGQSRTWRFSLPPTAGRSAIQLRYRVTTPDIRTIHLAGTWTALDAEGEPVITIPVLDARDQPVSLNLPPSVIQEDGTMRLAYRNEETENRIVIPPAYNPVMLRRAGTFTANYLRATGIVLVQLLFWAAIGVTAGCLFSQPVAAFLAVFLAILSTQGNYLARIAREYSLASATGPGLQRSLLAPLYTILDHLVRPLQTPPVINLLTAGELIDPGMLVRDALTKLLLYSFLLALIGVAVFRRREPAAGQL